MLLPEFPAFSASFVEKKRRKNRTDAPKYYVAGNHEPIISKETFAAVQQELVRRADMVANGRKKRVYSGKYPFSGLLFCGSCGDIFSRVVWEYSRSETDRLVVFHPNAGRDRDLPLPDHK